MEAVTIEADAWRARAAIQGDVIDLVEIFDEDRFRFRRPAAGQTGEYEAGVPMEVFVVDVVLEGGEWREAPRSESEPIGQIQLIWRP